MRVSALLVVAASCLAVLAHGARPALAAPEDETPPGTAETAGGTDQCVAAHLENQKLRKQGKLSDAKKALLVCVQEGCPPPVRAECETWLDEVEAKMPTIVVTALDAAGKDTVDVSVSIDGRKVIDRLDGRPLAVDPGQHAISCEHHGVSQVADIVTVQGQKDRPVVCDYTKKAEEPLAVDRGQPVAAYVLGALSLGAFASFVGFGVTGKREADDLQTSCGKSAPLPNTDTCTDDDIDPVRAKLIVADVSLGVGVVLFAVGLGLFIHHFVSDPDPPAAALSFGVGPIAGGAAAEVAISF